MADTDPSRILVLRRLLARWDVHGNRGEVPHRRLTVVARLIGAFGRRLPGTYVTVDTSTALSCWMRGVGRSAVTSITLLTPVTDQVFHFGGQPILVSGRAVGHGMPAIVEVDGVVVSVEGSPVQASLSVVAHQKVPAVSFNAVVPAPSGTGHHEVIAVATFDDGSTATATVNVVIQNVTTPRESLTVSVANPAPPSSDNWAADIVKANRTTDLGSWLSLAVWVDRGDRFPICAREWVQIGDATEDYDLDPVGFSGWLLRPEVSGADVPFTHPFGHDWECLVALDPEYAGLLAPGNAVPDGADGAQAMADAHVFSIPVPDGGLLAVETDGGNVPSALKAFDDTVRVEDRIAVFGRWIVDAGHSVPMPTGGPSYRSEVHPPLLMAIGGTRPDVSGETLTRIVMTSRPYLAQQVFTTDTNTINDDSAPDDGTLLKHLNNEVDKLHGLVPDSWTLEAHPKIASKPFTGVHLFRLSVHPPASGAGGIVGGIVAAQVQVSFQFTCRSGVGVEVVGQGDHVDVLVALNSAGYHPAPLPPRQTDTWTKDRLNAVDSGSSDLITFEQIVSVFEGSPVSAAAAEHALAHGVETDTYAVPDVDALSRSHAVPFVSTDQIPADQGIVVDDGQPYPVIGFLEIRQIHPDTFHGAEMAPGAVPDQPSAVHPKGKQT